MFGYMLMAQHHAKSPEWPSFSVKVLVVLYIAEPPSHHLSDLPYIECNKHWLFILNPQPTHPQVRAGILSNQCRVVYYEAKDSRCREDLICALIRTQRSSTNSGCRQRSSSISNLHHLILSLFIRKSSGKT